MIEEGTAIVDIGGGSIQISLFDNDTLVSTQNLRIGVLRLQELLHHMNTRSSQREELIDEIVSAQLATYKKLYLKDREIKTIIVVDDYLSVWVSLRVTPGAHICCAPVSFMIRFIMQALIKVRFTASSGMSSIRTISVMGLVRSC